MNLYQKMWIVRSIRYALTIFMLVVVWNHAHWSVAGSLTLMTISIESLTASLNMISKMLKARRQSEAAFLEELQKNVPPEVMQKYHE